MAESAIANPAMANPAMAKSKRQIVSSIEDGPSEYDREKYHSHLIERYKLYVEMVDRPDIDLPPRPARRCRCSSLRLEEFFVWLFLSH